MLFANVCFFVVSACSLASAASLAGEKRPVLQSRADAQAFVAITTGIAPVTTAIQSCYQKVKTTKDVQQVANILADFQKQAQNLLGPWNKPCGCQADSSGAATFISELKAWLTELQEIIQYVSSTFPTTYKQYCGGILSSIGAMFETVITPAASAGVDVSSAVAGFGLNDGLFANVNIQTSTFKKTVKKSSSSSSSTSSSSTNFSSGSGRTTHP